MTEAREGSDHRCREGGDLGEAYDMFLKTLEDGTDDEQDCGSWLISTALF